jgi:uncharacterized protein (TIGR02246 family)
MDDERSIPAENADTGDALHIAQALALALDEAWNARDAAAMAALFEPEGDFTLFNGIHIHGSEAIARFWSERVFPMTPEGLRHLGSVKWARNITRDVVLAGADLRIYDPSLAPDAEAGIPTEAIHRQTEAVGLGVRVDDRWQFSMIQLWIPERD